LAKANRILQQELAVHKQAALLARESEGKNRDLVDNIKLGIFRCTPGLKGKFLEVNRAMEEITGFSRDELLQMDMCSLFVDSEDSDPFINEVNITDWKVTRELCLKKKRSGSFVAETIVAIRLIPGCSVVTFWKISRANAQIQVQRLQRYKGIKDYQAMAISERSETLTAGHQRPWRGSARNRQMMG
jgi:PAS domain S-box-containing protein